MRPSTLVATWNLERKTYARAPGMKAIEYLTALGPHVLVLTEARQSYPAGDGSLVTSQSWGSDDERKVVMQSQSGWRDIDDFGHPDLPAARFVAATTSTPIGDIRVMGVCISWHMANVVYGDRDKKPWQDHIAYCEVLQTLIEAHDRSVPLVIAGDFNQCLPRVKGANRAAAAAIGRTFADTNVITADEVVGHERPAIDHIAVVGLDATSVIGWHNIIDGQRCTDHSGVMADLTAPS
ncbi:MAG: hypothetical protein ACKVIY_08145 [Acidimicrobiales bacterium]